MQTLRATIAAACLFGLVACTGSGQNGVTLQQVQAAAANLQTIVKNDVVIYEGANPNSPYIPQIEAGAKSLNAAISVFCAIQPGASYQSDISAFLSVVQAVLAALPPGALSANDQLLADTLIANLQLLLPLLPPAPVVK